MLVFPAINEIEFSEVQKKIELAKKFVPADEWIHLDVVDGKFASNTTWNNPDDLKSAIGNQQSAINFEAHLMVENPELVIGEWISAGVKRIILSLEAIIDKGQSFLPKTEAYPEMGLAINPETPVESLLPYLENFKFVLILGVNPGLAGKKFQESVLEKIIFLKKYYPDVIIEADGGINAETAKLAKEAGADIVISASYIWGSENPEKAFQELSSI